MRLRDFLFPRSRYPSPSLDVELRGARVTLRLGDPADWRDWRSLRELSRCFLTPWGAALAR